MDPLAPDVANELTPLTYESVPKVSLDEVKATVQDGRLVFADLMEYEKARKAVSNASKEEIAVWTKTLGYSSMYLAYDKWMQALPDDESALTVSVPPFIHIIEKGYFDVNAYSLINSFLANEAGQFKIGTDLHSISYSHHVTIAGGNEVLLSEVDKTFTSDSLKGVFVQEYPSTASERDGVTTKILRTLKCPRNQEGVNEGSNAVIDGTDEQNRENMTAGMILTTTKQFESNGKDVKSLSYSGEAFARNRQKKGTVWRSTYPNFRIWEYKSVFLLRRVRGQKAVSSCSISNCPTVEHIVVFDGRIDTPGFTDEFEVKDFGAIVFDSGVYTNSNVASSVSAKFTIRDLRYDFQQGQSIAKWTNRNTGIEVIAGCPN